MISGARTAVVLATVALVGFGGYLGMGPAPHLGGWDGAPGVGGGPSSGNSSANSTLVPGLVGTASVGQFPSYSAFDAADGWVYTADQGTGNVSVLDGATVVATVSVGLGASGIVYDPANQTVYVCSYNTNTVSILMGTALVRALPVGTGPEVPAYDSNDSYVYVPNFASGTVSVLNGTAVVATIPVGTDPDQATFDSADGTVYVTNEESTVESVLNGTTLRGNVTTRLVAPFFTLFDPVNDLLYVTNYTPTGGTGSGLSVLSGMTTVATLPIGPGPGYGAVDSQNGRVYVPLSGPDQVQIVIGKSLGPTVGVNGFPTAAAFDPGNGLVYVANDLTDDVSVINGTQLSDDVEVGVNPDLMIYDPLDGNLYVSDSGSEQVSVIGLVTGWAVRFQETGLAAGTPWSVAVGAVSVGSSTATVVQFKPNGTYSFKVSPVTGYSVSPGNGTVQVEGQPLAVSVAFTGHAPPAPPGLFGLPNPYGTVILGIAVAVIAGLIAWGLYLREMRRRERMGRLAPVSGSVPGGRDWAAPWRVFGPVPSPR
ncbi:MAG: YncE family protein [Thermoplasmata archaeon]